MARTDRFPYLFGWLAHQRLFWIALLISALPALSGKSCFSLSTFAGFCAGLLLGELFGGNPAGALYGHGHYGWAVWAFTFLFSIVMGIILEKLHEYLKTCEGIDISPVESFLAR